MWMFINHSKGWPKATGRLWSTWGYGRCSQSHWTSIWSNQGFVSMQVQKLSSNGKTRRTSLLSWRVTVARLVQYWRWNWCCIPMWTELCRVIKDFRNSIFHDDNEEEPLNRRLRIAAYRSTAFFLRGKLGRGNRIVIPACIKEKIRELCPNPPNIPYEGHSSR